MTFSEEQIAAKMAELAAWAARKGSNTLMGFSPERDREMALQALRVDAAFAKLKRIGGSHNVVR